MDIKFSNIMSLLQEINRKTKEEGKSFGDLTLVNRTTPGHIISFNHETATVCGNLSIWLALITIFAMVLVLSLQLHLFFTIVAIGVLFAPLILSARGLAHCGLVGIMLFIPDNDNSMEASLMDTKGIMSGESMKVSLEEIHVNQTSSA